MANLNYKEFFFQTPTAADVVTDSGLGTLHIGGDARSEGLQIPYGNGVTWECDVVCATPCQRSEETITFPTIDFGNCSSCLKTIGVRVKHAAVNYGPALHGGNDLPTFYYNGGSGSVTGAAIATDIYNQIQNYIITNRGGILHGVEVTRSGATLTFKTTCPLVFPIPHGVFAVSENLAASELAGLTTAVVQAGIPAANTLTQLRAQYGYVQNLQYIPGEDLSAAFFESCAAPCIITLRSCLSSCNVKTLPPMGIGSQGYMADITIVLIVNASAPGYAAWLGAINTALGTSCNAALAPASNGLGLRMANAAVTSGAATIANVQPSSLLQTNFTGLLKTTLSNNASTPLAVDVYHLAEDYTAANLASAFIDKGVTTVAAEPDVLTVSAAAAAGATTVSLTTIIP